MFSIYYKVLRMTSKSHWVNKKPVRDFMYEGSAAEWENIAIGSKNYALSALPKQFTEQ